MDWDKLGEKLALGMAKTITYSQPLFGTFDEETVIQPKEVKEKRRNTTNKNVIRPFATQFSQVTLKLFIAPSHPSL